jgi:phage terminase large subunit
LKVNYEAFNAGGGVQEPDKVFMELPHTKITNKQQFSNIKAQFWWIVAERFRKTYEFMELAVPHPIDELLSIDAEAIPQEFLKKLQKELAQPRKDIDGQGRFKVESKDDMRKRQVKSPNLADAFIMAYVRPKRAPATFF